MYIERGRSQPMTEQQDPLDIAWRAKNFEELDREIGRLSMLCEVRILDPGVIDRVLKNDATVCGIDNRVAFSKLRNLLMMHFAERKKSVETLGQVQTARIEAHVIEQLRDRFADLLGKWPPS
jgi:hypothetical protein